MLVWYAAGLLAAVAIAWLAAILQLSGHAPVGILSLGVGIVLGTTIRTLATMLQVANRRRLVVGTVILALVTVLAQHAWLYQDFRRQWHEARAASAEVAMFRTETPWSAREYFRRELTAQRAALWCLDAALITAAAVGAVLMIERNRRPIRPDGRRQTSDT